MILYKHQYDAVNHLHNGAILCGGVGSGKSRASLYYYIKDCGGDISTQIEYKDGSVEMIPGTQFKKMSNKRNLYIITTAKKRDDMEWIAEYSMFGLPRSYEVSVIVDSWNNIKKYSNIYGAFFIFDEQRVVGNGAWVKAFLIIAKKNRWIMLSATPGDTWSDYIPVFVANGFYKNRTEFQQIHCVFSRFSKYPKIERYVGEKLLEKHRDLVLVGMKDLRITKRNEISVPVLYDKELYRTVMKDRWDPFLNEPIAETGKLVYLLRFVANTHASRLSSLVGILEKRHKLIIFYNFTYELTALRHLFDELMIPYKEWNGEKHEYISDLFAYSEWAYLVQYSAGCEGWNCTETDTIVFFSQTYSYRVLEQASGRIDRINTPFTDLYYYHFRSRAPIDLAIYEKIKKKESFNERAFLRKRGIL